MRTLDVIDSNMRLPILALALLPLVILSAQAEGSDIVINEIMYHPPNDLEELEYIELYNPGKTPVDLSGWKFTKGIRYTFPKGTIIESDGYLVVCRALDEFRAAYGEDIIALGNFKKKLSNSGERITLSDNTGRTIDSVEYADRSPWPVGADGYSSSLERICPESSGEASNWAPSPLPMDGRRPTGTPGRRNANYSKELPPVISEVEFYPQNPKPNQPVAVRAKVTDKDVVSGLCPRFKVALLYRVAKPGYEGEEMELPMKLVSEGGKSGLYEAAHKPKAKVREANIPGQPARSIVRFRIKAVGDSGAVRFQPNQHEPKPAYSYFIYENTESATIPICFIINVDEELYQTARRNEEQRRRRMAMEILHRGANLEAAWLHHTLEQELNAEQIRKLREIYRGKFDASEKMVADIVESRSLSEDIRGFPDKVKAFSADLLKATEAVLTEEQHIEFANWYRQHSLTTAMRGSRRGPKEFLRRFINLEASWFFLTITFDLSEPQFEKLKTIYREAFKARREIVNIAEKPDEEDGRKRSEIFGRVLELRRSIPEKVKRVLTEDQQERFSRWLEENSPFGMNPPGPKPPPPRGKSAFVYISPDTRTYQIYDYINVAPRTGGYKVRFHKDQPLNGPVPSVPSQAQDSGRALSKAEGMTTINVIFEYMPRFVLAEHLAYELYKRAGVPTEYSEFIRLSIDDYLLGYHLLIEQPNRNFLRRHKRDDKGNLYKILWYEEGVVNQHEKKMNIHTGHDDVVSLISALNNTKGEEQWNLIKRHFNVQEVINYFAVNICISIGMAFGTTISPTMTSMGAANGRFIPGMRTRHGATMMVHRLETIYTICR